MKQTAVEWLVEQILVEVDKYNDDGDVNGKALWNAYIGSVDLSEYVDKAKELEKQQYIEAYRNGRCDQQSKFPLYYNRTAEQDYNENFNK